MADIEKKVAGGLWGMLVGDALGVPYEFHGPAEIPPSDQIEMTPPKGFRASHARVKAGTWSDDGAQGLCLLASLLDRDGLDVEDLGKRFVRWYTEGYMAVDHVVFDVGIQTAEALRAIQAGTPAIRAGPADERKNGNGSLMRVLPLALWHRGTDEELVELAHLQSLPTHGHARSQACCAFYCLWVRYLMREEVDADVRALATLERIYGENGAQAQELGTVFPDGEWVPRGTGYVVDCLRSALHVMREKNYESVVRAAIRLGNDTDTTACVAGGVAGVREGIDGIPPRWMGAMKGKEIVEGLLEQLVRRYR